MNKKKLVQSEPTLRKAALEIVSAFMQSGEEEICIRPVKVDGKKQVSISSPLNEEISDTILDKVAVIARNISWSVIKNDCDELCIVLHKEPSLERSVARDDDSSNKVDKQNT